MRQLRFNIPHISQNLFAYRKTYIPPFKIMNCAGELKIAIGRLEGKGKMRKGTNPRSRWEIILDILRVMSEEEMESEGKVKKTRIMQRAYLDWWNFQNIFGFLIEQGFVEKSNSPEEGTSYELTAEGKDLMKRLREVEDILRQPNR